MQPSTYQQAILRAIDDCDQSLMIEARAGSGKTSTLMMLYKHPTVAAASSIFLAFNKSIATELQARGITNAATFHSVGFKAIGKALYGRNRGKRMVVDANKVSAILDRIAPNERDVHSPVQRLVSLCKNAALMPRNLTDDTLYDFVDHFDIEWSDKYRADFVFDLVREALTENNRDTLRIDFDDMLYFVVVFDAKVQQYDFVMTDEAQDTNAIQRLILRRMMHTKSRLIAVGDPAQAIYGFRGASHDAMDLIRDDFKCITLPLSVSYRCPVSVIKEAQRFVPDILWRDNAPDGTVATLTTWKRTDFLPTDLLVCRNTAPLVQTAYKMIASRIPCKIMGREIGRGLTSLIKKVSKSGDTLETFSERLDAYKEKEVSIALAKKREQKAQNIADKCDAIIALIGSMTADDIDGGIPRLIAIIDGMFADQKNGCTTLATVHKAKGLEAPRVFILDPQLMPSKYARQAWQIQQERNLQYVAITRALDTLYFVESERIVD